MHVNKAPAQDNNDLITPPIPHAKDPCTREITSE